MKTPHQPVLLSRVIEALAPQEGQAYLDGTAGYGGHAAAIMDQLGPDSRIILVDRDARAIQALSERFSERVEVVHASFLDAAQRLIDDGSMVDMILLDLGVSSPQIDTASRGFSFRTDAALDMRMDQAQSLTAHEVVNHYPARQLEQVIREYGEEPRARTVTKAIIDARPINGTLELAKIIRRSAAHTSDIDSATKTFQAIRIEVNGELTQLNEALPLLVRLLYPGGRIAVISFHSLEDRIVKQFFDTESRDCICPPKQPICTCRHTASLRKRTRGPITGDSTEIAINPRVRSAKLRAAEKTNQNKRSD